MTVGQMMDSHIFCKFLDKLPVFRQASERVSFLYLQKSMMVG